jgi:hypothetical protein
VYVLPYVRICASEGLKGKGIRGVGGRADKEAYTVYTINIIFQREYFVAYVSFPVSMMSLVTEYVRLYSFYS